LGLKTVGEGEEFSADFMPKIFIENKCKFGLKSVSASKYTGGEFGCLNPMCDCFVCTKCGDGICGKGENSCNCKEDCKDGEGEKSSLEDVYHPVAYKSDDFVDTGFSYDPNYDFNKDELSMLIDTLDKYINDANTHDYKDGGHAFSMGEGPESFDWIISSKNSKIKLTGKYLSYEYLDSKEREKAKNVFQNNGFSIDTNNSFEDVIGYSKNNLVCLYEEKPEVRGIKILCGDISNPSHDTSRYRRSE
ncbi:MAG TPA: hypothetical protein VK255_03840, partial [Patescibacteria group bacterium]|nr:hypothetical protein [Patescibacteria group bacterium]